MENRIAVVAVIISDPEASGIVNEILHEYRDYVLGRQGIPYKEKGVSVISLILDAPQETLNGLSGKLGMVKGVKSKVLVTK